MPVHMKISGELAGRDEKCEDAIPQFSEAISFICNFAEAYLGKGLCLVSLKKYEEAIPPLRNAERLTPGNPEVHHACYGTPEIWTHRGSGEGIRYSP